MDLRGQSHLPAALSPEETPGEQQNRRKPGHQRMSGRFGEDKYVGGTQKFPELLKKFI